MLLAFSALSFSSCGEKLKLEVPVITNPDKVKPPLRIPANYAISKLNVAFTQPLSDEEALISYQISGSINSRALGYEVLDKVLVEQPSDTLLILTPIAKMVGKAPDAVDIYNFEFTNQYKLKIKKQQSTTLTVKCGEQEAILRITVKTEK